jgi:hypothetical protein
MSIRSLRAGRGNYDASTYLGTIGELFYIEDTGEFRLCDAVTPGGLPILIAIATATVAGGILPGALLSVTSGGVLNVNYSGSFSAGGAGINTLTLNPASQTVLGGIKLSPGLTINAEGQLLIDSEGLEFTFGDFSGTVGTYTDTTDYALLQSLNENEDIAIASNGTGSVNIVGEFNVFATNSNVTDALESFEPIFRVLGSGKVRMIVPAADTTAGAFEIVGNAAGAFHPVNQTGVILHTTGQVDTVNRVYHDAVNNYPIIVGRRYNGTVGALENVKSGETIFRLAGQASTGTDFETFGPAKINWIATEDQGPTNQGGKITIDVTANGTTAFGNAITVAEFTEDGIKSTSIIPQLDEIYNLGSPDKRWANVYIGKSSLFIADQTTSNNVEISVNNGTLLLDGAENISLGSMRIVGTRLTTVDGADDIILGQEGATGYVRLDTRDLKFSDGTVQSTAWTDEHYANTLLGTTLADNVLNSSLTSVGTLTGGTIGAGFTAIANARLANSAITVNGVSIALGDSGTVTAAAGTLTGTTLNSTVVNSSLTSVGTLTNLTVTNTITGSVSGNAGTATNGVVTTGSYANPTWITSLAGTKVTDAVLTTDTGTVTNTMLAGSIANNKLANSSITINGTSIALGGSATITAVAAAGTLTGTTLASNVVTSSLTAVGTLTNLTVTNPIVGSMSTALTAGTYLTSGGTYNGGTARTFAVDATTTATASKVVARDINGDTFANQVNDSKGDVRSVPINGQSGAYNLADTDNGKMISITTGGVSVLQNVFASPYGQIVSIYNDSNSSQTITQGAGVTLRLAGTASTGNRTLARYGVATITCVASNIFVISGAGLT